MTLDHPTLPPLHNSPTIPEALDFHAEHNAVHPIYAFSQNGEINATQITFLEFARASHRIAHALRPDRKGPAGQVVGVIMLVDTILYQTTTAGLLRAGLIVRPCFTQQRFPQFDDHVLAFSHVTSANACRSCSSNEENVLPPYHNDVRDAPGSYLWCSERIFNGKPSI
jgi:acyl-CoA synthetase (AMP-forming)/AMP-acid ligase II